MRGFQLHQQAGIDGLAHLSGPAPGTIGSDEMTESRAFDTINSAVPPIPSLDTLIADLSHSKTQLAAIERVSHALFHTIDLDQLVETTLRIALEEVDAEAGSILLADHETRQLIFHYSIGERPVPRGTAIAWDSGICGAVFQPGAPR